MNKNFSISKTGIYLILLVLILIAYVILYFFPAQKTAAVLQSDITRFAAETKVYRDYLADPSILENDIDDIQVEIDRMLSEDFTNSSNVSFVIGEAIHRFDVSLASVSISEESTYDDYRVLPINLVFNGELNNIHKFIDFFEQNKEGAYRIHNVSLKLGNSSASAVMVVYLCTPNV